MSITLSERDEIRAEVISELRTAFAAHSFRQDPEDSDACIHCRLSEDAEKHLRCRQSPRSLICEILGDIPIHEHIYGHHWCLRIDPIEFAEQMAFKAGLTDRDGYPIAPAPALKQAA